jgi:hypothetical protein
VWLFGHPFEAVGRRALLLQEAFVHTVVNNPDPELGSYKLAAPGRDIGTITNDALAAVVGRGGGLPRTTAVVVNARDVDADRSERTDVEVADEAQVDLPAGISPLSFVAPLVAADASVRVLRSLPARQSGSACVQITLLTRTEPLRYCNRYVTRAGGGIGGGIADDLGRAVALIDDADFASLSVARVEADIDVRRGTTLAYILGATLPRQVRRGSTVTVSLRTRVVRGPTRRFVFRLRIPSNVRPGLRELRLQGEESDDGGELGLLLEEEFGEGIPEEEDEGRPSRTLDELLTRFDRIQRYDGIVAKFSGRGQRERRVFRDPDMRIAGKLVLRLRVTR